MDLLLPHTGTIVWMLFAFSIVFFLLKKFAWKPILNALKERESSIDDALLSAEKAKKDMESLQANNEIIINEAKQEREQILKEARKLKDEIINEAKSKASTEAEKIIQNASEVIKSEKAAAIKEIKEQIATLSVVVAEKILQEKLGTESEQKEIIDKYLQSIKMN